ncbi:glycosyltransferase family 4 protein [Pseudalkalibacillus hwajinpoensis]|uniref:glycosyltransferase family 4 protein n=1 Tax=Guptibacillus hwajinpoensis TaxID=208199 RepID=UPI00325B53E2
MKVLHINSNYLYTTLFDKMVQHLNLLGVNNTVFMPTSGKINFVIPPKEFVHHPVSFNKKDSYFFYLKQAKIFKSLKLNLDVTKFDLVHAHTLFTDGCIAYKLKKKYGLRYIVAVRNTDVNTFFKYMVHMRGLGIKILKEAEKIIFLSESYKKLVLEKYVPRKIKAEISYKSEVIPNGIDEFWFKNKGDNKDLVNKYSLNLVYAGTINKNKNIINTIKSIDILEEEGYSVIFTVVGRIVDDSIYQQILSKPYVKYITQKAKEDLIDIYRKNDIFVMPSKTETFGLVYAEAMSQGLPIVYTKNQGFDGQFKEGKVGFHVEWNDPREIADRIIDISRKYKELSINSIELNGKFNWIEISQKYKVLYKLSAE